MNAPVAKRDQGCAGLAVYFASCSDRQLSSCRFLPCSLACSQAYVHMWVRVRLCERMCTHFSVSSGELARMHKILSMFWVQWLQCHGACVGGALRLQPQTRRTKQKVPTHHSLDLALQPILADERGYEELWGRGGDR